MRLSFGKIGDIQSPPKKSIHLRQSQVLKDQGKYRKSRGFVTPQMELVQSGQSLILIFQEMAKQGHAAISLKFKMRLGPVWTNSIVGLAHPQLFIWPPSVLSGQLDKSVYFLLGETVRGHIWFSQMVKHTKYSVELCHIICITALLSLHVHLLP